MCPVITASFLCARVEKQRVVLQEKIAEQQKQAQKIEAQKRAEQSATQLKAQLEEQLKAQRLAMQQKRAQMEKDKAAGITTTVVATPGSAIKTTTVRLVGDIFLLI